jgi:hypothetical protein
VLWRPQCLQRFPALAASVDASHYLSPPGPLGWHGLYLRIGRAEKEARGGLGT